MCAGAFLEGNASPWEPGGYAYMWPHQNGMILLVALLLRFVDTVQSFYAMYVILIVFYAVTIVGLYQICCLLFGKNAFTAVQGVILATYLPYAFLINNIYSDHIGYGFAVVAVWMALLYRKSRRIQYSVLCGINISTANLKAIYYDKQRKAMWVGTHLGGLCRVDVATGHVTTYKHHSGDIHSLPSNIVRSITPYGKKLIIGTHRGVAIMDPDAKGESCFTKLLADKNLLAVPSTCVDKKGYLWIATEGIGVFRINPKNGSYQQFTHSSDNNSTPSSNYVNHIMLDRMGRLWFSMANNSICLYNEKNNTFTTYGDAEGLTSDCVYATSPSTLNNRDILLITNRGFSVFDFEKRHFHNYDRSNGFPLESINENALYASSDGTVFLGGIDGMVSFNERDLYKKAQPYHIGFSRLYVNGEKISPDDKTGILTDALRFTKEVVLDHDQRVFSVEVYTTNFFKTNAAPLQFRLRGVSDRWFNVRGKQLSFNGLSSGKYTLEVRSTDGKAAMATLQIHILPPWYLSWWAYLIYIVTTGCGICRESCCGCRQPPWLPHGG